MSRAANIKIRAMVDGRLAALPFPSVATCGKALREATSSPSFRAWVRMANGRPLDPTGKALSRQNPRREQIPARERLLDQ